MKLILIATLLSFTVFPCALPQYKIQNDVIQKLIAKYSADKDNPIESIRRVDFTGMARVRFIYLAKGLATKNIVQNFEVSKQCGVKFKELEF